MNYLQEHPLLWQIGLFPFITFLVSWLFKPRTPEDYAALNPRVAAALKFVAAVGFDAPKILESIAQMVQGKARTVSQEKDK